MDAVSPPKVSVLMVTYNHQSFIEQAVRSALEQETTFPFEIVIGEDCSTDATRSIVERLAREHPERIRLVERDRRVGMHQNFIETLASCRGEYVALLEGDDFWTCPHKLQKQVDFLDHHPECATSFHKVTTWKFSTDGSREVWPGRWKTFSSCEDLLNSNFIPTCSAVFRRGLFREFPEWIHELPLVDWILHILNAQQGKIGFLDEVMGCYRIHSGGMYSRLSFRQQQQAHVGVYDRLEYFLPRNYRKNVREQRMECLYQVVLESQKAGDRELTRLYTWKFILARPLLRHLREKLLAAARMIWPGAIARLSAVKARFRERSTAPP